LHLFSRIWWLPRVSFQEQAALPEIVRNCAYSISLMQAKNKREAELRHSGMDSAAGAASAFSRSHWGAGLMLQYYRARLL
jgi:hypothetical protein